LSWPRRKETVQHQLMVRKSYREIVIGLGYLAP
jgi:hypothetical protein